MMSNKNEAKTRRGVTLFFTSEELALVLKLAKNERSSLSRIAERLILAEAEKLEAATASPLSLSLSTTSQSITDEPETNTLLPFVSEQQNSYDILG